MSKIVTVTFNPALDKSTEVQHVYPESKMRCESPKFEPGGGGINVSRALTKINGDSIAVYTKGGPIGEIFEKLLDDEGVKQDPVKVEAWTRENFIVVETNTNHQFRFGMPGSAITEEEIQLVFDQVKSQKDVEIIVGSGSLPPGTNPDVYARLAKLAKEMGAKFFLDCSGEPLKLALEEGVFFTKPNQKEIGKLTGVDPNNVHELETAAKKLIEEGKSENLLVSLGAAGAFLVTKENSYRVQPPTIHKRTTVGAGDSMVAGFVYAYANNWSLEEATMYAVSTGSAATMNTGTELCKLEDVEKLFNYIKENR